VLNGWDIGVSGWSFDRRLRSTGTTGRQRVCVSGHNTRTYYTIFSELLSESGDFRVIFFPFRDLSRSGQLRLFLESELVSNVAAGSDAR
jgi:hypothetical protein